MNRPYLVVEPVAGVALVSLVHLPSLVHLLSLVQAFLSPPVQHFMVHFSSLQLPVQVQPFPLQPPSLPANADKLVIPTMATAKNNFFMVLSFYLLPKFTHYFIKQTDINN
jgi:hypothetical protein